MIASFPFTRRFERLVLWCFFLLITVFIGNHFAPLSAAEGDVPPNAMAATLAQLTAANAARAELARNEAAWRLERDRLLALIAAAQAEQARLEAAATAAENERDVAIATTTAMNDSSRLQATSTAMAESAARMRVQLQQIAANVPPGTIATVDNQLAGEALFDAVIHALDVSERAATTITVEVVTGQRDGHTEAVKLLRAAGAAAWWVSLDGQNAGIAQMNAGNLHLHNVPDRREQDAIRSALAQAEGRSPPALVVMPLGNNP
jgi:hypothetical protein